MLFIIIIVVVVVGGGGGGVGVKMLLLFALVVAKQNFICHGLFVALVFYLIVVEFHHSKESIVRN